MKLRKTTSLIIFSALFLLLFSSNVAAHTALIENSGENKYKAVRLTPEIYSKSNRDLSDLLVKDENGEHVPYFFNNEGQAIYKKSYFVETLKPEFNTEEKDQTTFVYVKGLKNLRLKEITIHTDSMFKRMVEASFGISKELYNLSFEGSSSADTTIPLNRNIVAKDSLVLAIQNGDDKPIKIKKVTIKYYADELVFEGKKEGVYTIHFSGDDTKTAPVYDIEAYKKEILAGDIDRLTIKKVIIETAKPVKEEMPQHDYKTIFNIVIVVVAVILGALLLLKLRKKS